MAKKETSDLLFEIQCEELPAGYIPRALDRYASFLEKALATERLSFKAVEKYGTPRRLVLVVRGLIRSQPDTVIEIRGPKVEAAYDREGKPTKTLTGFARAKGVAPEEIKRVRTEKGEFVVAVKEVMGKRTAEVLPALLESILSKDVFPRSMRWSDHEATFARPVHGILALFGDEKLKVRFGHIESTDSTRGHRFSPMRKTPDPEGRLFKVKSPASYFRLLEENFVIVDPEKRKKIISDGIKEKAREVGANVLDDPGLLEEVTYLVEYPVVVRGAFDGVFLELPREVIINAMRSHQRYFTVVDKNGKILPHFITVADTPAKDLSKIVRGNEKVLRARLNDARFYFEKDIKKPLTEMARELGGVIFQAGLGTSYEKVMRFTRLALCLGAEVGFCEDLGEGEGPEDFFSDSFNPARYDPEKTDPALYAKFVLGRAAVLSKADLVSGVVGEFPDLQGVMGGIYALGAGERPEVAAAIGEHYRPTGAADATPSTMAGSLIAIADRLDSIVGFFALGKAPTGAVDPYGLRRQALAVITILRAKDIRLRLDRAVKKAAQILEEKLGEKAVEAAGPVLEFFRERLRNSLLAEGLSFDSIDAVLSTDWYDVPDAVKRIRALEEFKKDPACADLVIAFKRVSNILRGFEAAGKKLDEKLLKEDEEKALYRRAVEIAPVMENHRKAGDYRAALMALVSIKETIDAFFDHVLVMVDDEKTRTNRLQLLDMVRGLYSGIADLSKLAV